MKTSILFDEHAREKILRGINTMADTVAITLSPRGNNVALAKTDYKGEIYARDVIHDGVSVARAIELEDEDENMGAQILKEAAQKQVDTVGDGTTVVMILAQAIINECFKMIATGVKPQALRTELETGLEKLIRQLKKRAKPVKTFDETKYIASISAQDEKLGELVADTLTQIGVEGIVTVEESKQHDTTVEYQTGMQLDKGWLHEYFMTNPDRQEAVLENASFLITDMPIITLVPLGNLLLECAKQGRKLVVIAPEVGGEALPLLIKNKLEGKLQTLCIKAPSFGQPQKNALHDIAILTGAKFINEAAADKFEDVTVKDLGQAEHITSTKSETIIVGGQGKAAEIKSRVAMLKEQIKEETSDYDREKLKERLAKLTNGIAVIRVGGQTEVEMKERRERIIDAVAATRAAMQEGIVPGGEIVYLDIRNSLNSDVYGENILYNALGKPFKKLIENAGMELTDAVLQLHQEPATYGIDVIDGQAKDMYEAGIVDPVAVPLNALKNAVSVAILLITTGGIINPVKQVVEAR